MFYLKMALLGIFGYSSISISACNVLQNLIEQSLAVLPIAIVPKPLAMLVRYMLRRCVWL